MNNTHSWWHSLEKVGKVKTFLSWVVLLTLPAIAVLLEVRQKVLEKQRDKQETVERDRRERKHAQEKAASERERAELTAQIARHEEQFRPRRITDEQRQKLVATTSAGPKGRLTLAIVYGDEEAAYYGRQLLDAIQAAGFTVENGGVWGLGSPSGLWLKINNQTNVPAHAIALLRGLRSAGIQVQAEINGKLSQDGVALYLGSKAIAAAQR